MVVPICRRVEWDSHILVNINQNTEVVVTSDASGSWGCGAYCKSYNVSGPFIFGKIRGQAFFAKIMGLKDKGYNISSCCSITM